MVIHQFIKGVHNQLQTSKRLIISLLLLYILIITLNNQFQNSSFYSNEPESLGNEMNISFQKNNSSVQLFNAKSSPNFSLNNIKSAISNVTLLSPLPGSIHNDSLLISWSVEDADGPPHQTNITLHWGVNQSKSFGIEQNYSKVIFISNLANRSDYWLELNVTDDYSFYLFNSSLFTINNPPHKPVITIKNPIITNTSVFIGNISIRWQQSDLNGDFLNTSLYIKQNQSSWLIASNQTSSENVVEWNSFSMPNGKDYLFDFFITDGIYNIHYLTENFTIDNSHMPEINLISPNGPNPVSKGFLNITWDIIDLDINNITGILEYRLLSNPFTWVFLRNISNFGSFIWDTGQVNVLNEEVCQLRLNVTDGNYSVLHSSVFITLIKPIPPVVLIQLPYFDPEVIETKWNLNFDLETYHPNAKRYMFKMLIYNHNTSTFTDMMFLERINNVSVNKGAYMNGISFSSPIITTLSESYREFFNWNTWETREFAGSTVSFLLVLNDDYFNITTYIGTMRIGDVPFEVDLFTPNNQSSYFGRYWESYYSITGKINSFQEFPSRIYNVKVTIEHEDNTTQFLGFVQIEAYPEDDLPINQSDFSVVLKNVVNGTFYGKVRYILEFSDGIYAQTYVTEYFELNVNHPTKITGYNIHDICFTEDCINQDNSLMFVNIQDQDTHLIKGEVILVATFDVNQRISLGAISGSQNFIHYLNYDWKRYNLNGEYILFVFLEDDFSTEPFRSLNMEKNQLAFNRTINFKTPIEDLSSNAEPSRTNGDGILSNLVFLIQILIISSGGAILGLFLAKIVKRKK